MIPIPFAALQRGETEFQGELHRLLENPKWSERMKDTSAGPYGPAYMLPRGDTDRNEVVLDGVYSLTAKPDASSILCPLYLGAVPCGTHQVSFVATRQPARRVHAVTPLEPLILDGVYVYPPGTLSSLQVCRSALPTNSPLSARCVEFKQLVRLFRSLFR